MSDETKPQELKVTLRFGGGINSRGSEDEIDDREASDGQNYFLDVGNRNYKPRRPFDLIGTVPNSAEVRGGICLIKSDGTIKTAFQAGNKVYEWNGVTTFTEIATVTSTCKLRGRIEHNWNLTNKVLITDLNLSDAVYTWDGTTWATMTENLAGSFKAKYCLVERNRAFFANVVSNSVATPHLIVGSKLEDHETLSVSARPSSSLAESDPFYLTAEDLRPINGLTNALGTITFSTENGSIYNLTGQSAKDFNIDSLYPFSFASGYESLVFVGNDVMYGRLGRIESVVASDKYGNVESDDISRWIQPTVETYKNWTSVYNNRTNLAYFFPEDVGKCLVFNQAILDTGLSPWMIYKTDHSMSFQPTFVMNMLDPADGLEYVFMGDASGNIYRMEGTVDQGDGNTTDISAQFTSRSFPAPENWEMYRVEGYIKYRKPSANCSATISLLYSGMTAFTETINITINGDNNAPVFGGDAWFGGDFYFASEFSGRLVRQIFEVAGQANEFQIKIATAQETNLEISEVGITFKSAN